MRHTVNWGSARFVRERGRALMFTLASLLLVAFGAMGGCAPETQSVPGRPNNNNGQCPSGQSQCGNACVDTSSNALNCGTCGNACPMGGQCTNGQCSCQGGLQACNGACVNVMGDGSNCGTCGNVCGAGLVCSLGQCSSSCAAGLMACGNSCVNTMTDIYNCGTCGNVCQTGMACTNGSCQCPPGANCGTPGAGGSTGSGGSGGSTSSGGTGGSGGSGNCEPGSGIEGGGYILNGPWKGYAFTAAADNAASPPSSPSTITPSNFGDTIAFPLCAQGTVGNTYDSVAMIGWNLNEEINDECGEMNPINPVTPTLDGIYIDITNMGGSPLRLQIQGPNGATDPNDRWCAPISASGFVSYDSFNTECWSGGMGTPYAGQPIVAALVLVPGDTAAPTPFNFCVNSIIESEDNAPPPGQGCSLSNGPGTGSQILTNDAYVQVTRDGRNYIVQNNVWAGNKAGQTVTVNSGVDFTVTAQSNSNSTSGAPASFPSVFIGSNFGRSSTNSGLPKQVSALTDVPTGWRWSGANGEMNAAYDVWFSTSPSGDSGNPTGGYLMVWFYDPPNAQPLGSPQGTATLAGRAWQIWQCPGACQNGVPVVSYVPTSGSISEMSFDLNDFIQHATTAAAGSLIKSNWYLTNIFAGFEIWSGGQGARTHDFCAIVQ